MTAFVVRFSGQPRRASAVMLAAGNPLQRTQERIMGRPDLRGRR
jgi:hypothetical protein